MLFLDPQFQKSNSEYCFVSIEEIQLDSLHASHAHTNTGGIM